MTTIVIKDLSENLELDRQAMAAITGGSRSQISRGPVTRKLIQRRATSILHYVVDHEKFGGLTGTPRD